ncbi:MULTISPECIES: DUF998 domain-containing protein [unclassified Nonomuraea]|uniref:DUF998 domain-containing protein n=1 Tax=unclassified Nonomuraea TaxID=2593643 RepID=UPI0033EB0995
MAMLSAGTTDHRLTTKLLLLCGAIGPVVFVAVYLIAGATRPGYSAWRHTISTLSLGDQGWIQIVNFMFYGLLTLCFAAGLRRVLRTGAGSLWGSILFFIVGLGLIAIGPFVSDPILGYPTATPAVASLGGSIHNLTSLIVFIALPAACFVLVRRFARAKWRGWTSYSIVTGTLAIAFFMLFFASVSAANGQDGGTLPAGLFERMPTVILGVWQALLALRLLSEKVSEHGTSSVERFPS